MKSLHLSLIIILLAVSVGGCSKYKNKNSTPGNDLVDGDSTWSGDTTVAPPDWVPFEAPEKNALVGQVVDLAGNAIVGVAVEGGGKSATTNYEGFYALEELEPADEIVVRFTHPAFSTVTKLGRLFLDGRATVNAVMTPRAAAKLLASDALSDLDFAGGSVRVPAGAVVDASGNAVSGPVMLRMTPVDVTGKAVLAAPGDFSAILEDQSESQLETFAMAEFAVVDEAGNPLQIKDGEKVTVEMLLPVDTDLTVGEEVPAWHFDEASGKWIEEGKGVVQEYSKDPSRLSYLVEVGHFSWWNCDKPMETTCVSGKVLLCDGSPASGADLMAASDEYDGTSSAFGSADGSFCILAKTGSQVRVVAAHGYGQQRVAAAATVTTPSTPATCPGPCANVDITLPCTPEESDLDCGDAYFVGCKGCLKGRVVTEDGNPVPYAAVEAKTGNTQFKRLADAQGYYCTPAALNAVTTIQARGNGASAGMITATATLPGACPSCEELPDVVVKKQENADIVPTTECVEKVGGVSLQSVVGNGVPAPMLDLDSAWGHVSYQVDRDNGEPHWFLDLFFVASKSNGALYGQPYAHLQFLLQESLSGEKTFQLKPLEGDETYSFSGRASSALGDVVGLGNSTYGMVDYSALETEIDYGFVKFSNGPAAVGSTAEGSFQLRFKPTCAPVGSELRFTGTFSLPVMENAFANWNTVPTEDYLINLQCSLISIYAWASNLEQVFVGAVQMEVDGLPVAKTDGDLFATAKYTASTDKITISMYADDMITIEASSPMIGMNAVSGGNYYGTDCYYYKSTGTVTIIDFGDPSTTTWWTGAFDVDFTEGTSSTEGTNCPDRKVTGQFGAAVCLQ